MKCRAAAADILGALDLVSPHAAGDAVLLAARPGSLYLGAGSAVSGARCRIASHVTTPGSYCLCGASLRRAALLFGDGIELSLVGDLLVLASRGCELRLPALPEPFLP